MLIYIAMYTSHISLIRIFRYLLSRTNKNEDEIKKDKLVSNWAYQSNGHIKSFSSFRPSEYSLFHCKSYTVFFGNVMLHEYRHNLDNSYKCLIV